MTEYHKLIWSPPPMINSKWIKVTMKNGDVQNFNAEYVETIEYIEEK